VGCARWGAGEEAGGADHARTVKLHAVSPGKRACRRGCTAAHARARRRSGGAVLGAWSCLLAVRRQAWELRARAERAVCRLYGQPVAVARVSPRAQLCRPMSRG
jgi:hypothetical protein